MEKKTTKQDQKYTYAKGGRKTAVAQCKLIKSGKGEITVNGKKFTEYFPVPDMQEMITMPLTITNHAKDVNVALKVHGGGKIGQAEACRHSIARALEVLEGELRPVLKAEGFLKRDPRSKERKKPGLRRARRAPQWSKR